MQQIRTKYGVICGLVYIVFGLVSILMSADSPGNTTVNIMITLVLTVATFFVIFFGIKEIRDTANNGVLTVGEGVKSGLIIAFIAGLISAVFQLLYHYVIDPEYINRILEATREGLEDQGMSDEQIDQAMKFTSMFRSPMVIGGFSVVWTTFMGILKGLISGAILKREPEAVL